MDNISMRTLFASIVLLLQLAPQAMAQTFFLVEGSHARPLIYGEASISAGSFSTGKLGLNIIIKKNSVLTFNFMGSTRPAPQTPADYHNGLWETPPQQSITSFGICYGEVLHCGKPRIRLLLKGGLCAGEMRTANGFQRVSPVLFGANYAYSTAHNFVMGLLLNPEFEFPTRTGFGLSAGAYVQANYLTAAAGIEVGLLFGHVRHRIRRRTPVAG